MILKGKVAVVTGAIALRLAQDGAAVVVNYAGSERRPGRWSGTSSRRAAGRPRCGPT